MQVRCISDKGGGGFIKKGKIYTVYAMLLSNGSLSLLLSEDFDFPMSHSIEQFEFLNNLLPLTWYFKFISKEESKYRKDLLKAIWGYKEIVYDPDHYYNLLEREPETCKVFARRKREIDEYEELRRVESVRNV